MYCYKSDLNCSMLNAYKLYYFISHIIKHKSYHFITKGIQYIHTEYQQTVLCNTLRYVVWLNNKININWISSFTNYCISLLCTTSDIHLHCIYFVFCYIVNFLLSSTVSYNKERILHLSFCSFSIMLYTFILLQGLLNLFTQCPVFMDVQILVQ